MHLDRNCRSLGLHLFDWRRISPKLNSYTQSFTFYILMCCYASSYAVTFCVTLRLQLSWKHAFACPQESRIVYCESVVCMAQTMLEFKHVLPSISRLPDVPGHDGALEMGRATMKKALGLSFCLLSALAVAFTFFFCVTVVASMCGGVRALVFLLELALVIYFFALRRLQGRAAQQSAMRWNFPHSRFVATPSVCWTASAVLASSTFPVFDCHASHVCLCEQGVLCVASERRS